MQHTIGCTSRPYSRLRYEEAYEHIAAAGYTDVAVFANTGQVPVHADSTPAEVAAVRRAAADAGVVPSLLIGNTVLDLGLEAAIEDYKKLIDHAADLGTSWLLDCGTGKEEHFESYFVLMRRVAPYAQQAGLNCGQAEAG